MRASAVGLTICILVARASAAEVRGADERQIVALEQEWVRALETKDRATLDRIVASDFTFIEPDGSVLHRDAYLRDRGPDSPAEVHSFEVSEMAVRILGDTAIVTGLSTVDESLAGNRYKYKLRWKEMWVRRSGSWQVLAGQATPVNVTWNAPFRQP